MECLISLSIFILVLLAVCILLQCMTYGLSKKSIKDRKKFRIIKLLQANSHIPPGDQEIYYVQAQTLLGRWITLSECNGLYMDDDKMLCFNTYELAEAYMKAYMENCSDEKMKIPTTEFDDLLEQLGGEFIVYRAEEKIISVSEDDDYYQYFYSDNTDNIQVMGLSHEPYTIADNTVIDVTYDIRRKAWFGRYNHYKYGYSVSSTRKILIEHMMKQSKETVYRS